MINTSSARSKHRDKNDYNKTNDKKLTAEIMNIWEFHMPAVSRAGTRDEPLRTSALEARRHRTHHREFCS